MDRSYRVWALAGMLVSLVVAGGCATTLPAPDFITKYTNNIAVPHPEATKLPTRTFLGSDGKDFIIRDEIPAEQGGGLLGRSVTFKCPADSMPGNFPQAFKPGDAILDGRKVATATYMIESYRANGGLDRPATGEWAGSPPQIQIPKDYPPKQAE